ncbi:hypothetical protein Hanom_Chr15g01358241 [Helianthus anomalus]
MAAGRRARWVAMGGGGGGGDGWTVLLVLDGLSFFMVAFMGLRVSGSGNGNGSDDDDGWLGLGAF